MATISLIVDNPARDLDGLVLQAFELASRGGKALLVPMYDQAYDVPSSGSDAVILNYLRPNNVDLAIGWKRGGMRILVLDTEGAAGKTAEDYAQLVTSVEGLDLVDAYCVWGEGQYRALLQTGHLDADRAVLTGCPRYDFCATQWQGALAQPDVKPGYLLVNTNFCAATPRFSAGPEAEAAAMVSAGFSADHARTFVADAAVAQRGMIELVRGIAMAIPDISIILRPHPFESHAPYESLLDLPQVSLRADGTSIQWIARASALLHLNCSTAIEAVMLGREPIAPEFLNTSALHVPAPSSVSRAGTNLQSIIDMIATATHGALPAPEPALARFRHDVIARVYFRIDGLAASRVADTVEKLLEKPTRPAARNVSARGRAVAHGRSLLGPGLFERIRAPVAGLSAERRAAKRFSAAHVRALLERIAAAAGKPAPTVRPMTARGSTGRSLIVELN
jgi:surface carbohydrate biosynthesis protein